MKYIKTLLLFVILLSCSKEFETPKEIVPEEALLSSCVDYSVADEDNLLTYWNLFVADVKCSRGGPDYGVLNTTVNIRFITPSAEEFASGITPDHAGYSTFYGYCNSDVVNIGVIKDTGKIIQKYKNYGLCIMSLVMMFTNMNTLIYQQTLCILRLVGATLQ